MRSCSARLADRSWDKLERALRPEKGLLGDPRRAWALRRTCARRSSIRSLPAASALKAEVVAGLDILIVRELTGGIYFGEPRGIRTLPKTVSDKGFNTDIYSESEIRRIGRVAFDWRASAAGACARSTRRTCSRSRCCGVRSWTELAAEYPDVELSHMYVDNAAMQLVRAPKQFDVVVTGNLFGDILSDAAAMLTGSIGMLPSASLDVNGKGMYEPVHGSAPDIAGQGKANPLATVLSAAMMLRYSFGKAEVADAIERAVGRCWMRGCAPAIS
jgi:3-isopropylmalate dehydrogenase